jgi:hypothetical protein
MSRSDGPDAPQVPTTPGRPFANGNPGRPPGSKNRTTLLAAELLEGEAEALVRKGVELAKAGDVVMLKFFLDRMLPRERLIKLDLPHMDTADDWSRPSGTSCMPCRKGGSVQAKELHWAP